MHVGLLLLIMVHLSRIADLATLKVTTHKLKKLGSLNDLLGLQSKVA